MAKVIIFKSMSNDGFISGQNDEIGPLHGWLFSTRRQRATVRRRKGRELLRPEVVNMDILTTAMAIEGATVIPAGRVFGHGMKPAM
jgi:hypothetical protein